MKRYRNMGKDKRTYKKVKGITEPIFNIAAYNCSRNYIIGRRNSKRATSQMLALVEYMHNTEGKNKG